MVFIIQTLLCYNYDCLLLYKTPEEVEILQRRMKEVRIFFEEKSNVAGYLGVLLDQDTNYDTITLSLAKWPSTDNC